jgi:murein DD-endopeptidase MepM/ murein hydrolase activator NlpD
MTRLGILRRAFLLLVVGCALFGLAVVTLRTGPAPSVELLTDARAIGPRTLVVARAAAAGRGLAGLRLELEQQGRVRVVAERQHRPLPPWRFGGEAVHQDELRADVGHRALEGLVEGDATLRVVAPRAATWLRAPGPVTREIRLPVRLRPPSLAVTSTQHYVTQGGSGVVVYRVGASAAVDYVQAGEWRFPGAPLEGGTAGERVALFGVPWDLEDPAGLRVVAEDDAGNAAASAFVDRFARRPPARDRIQLDDAFLAKVVPEIQEHTPGLATRGSRLDDYLAINRELRAANAGELRALAAETEPGFLFSEPFLPLPNGQVMSAFADQRTYFYDGREVDRQTHLGFDLAAVARTPVPAPNRGVVRLARYFGIYGNTVVLDHGLGLMTLSAHLSAIEVKEGQRVERGETIGRTGRTGLAGGDHLHFTTLVRGMPVSPIEWWDGKWIRERVAAKLAGGMATAPVAAVR